MGVSHKIGLDDSYSSICNSSICNECGGQYPHHHDGCVTLNLHTNKDSVSNNGGSSSYYELPPDCDTLQDIIVKQGMGFTQGNIFKAAYRWEKKPDLEYNLNKIVWFAEDALRRLYEQDPSNPRGCNYDHDRQQREGSD